MTCAPFGVHVRHPMQSSLSPLAATDPGVVLEEVPIRQPSHALHQEQPAAGGAICMHETELSDGPPTYRKTIGVYWACPAPSHLNLQSRLVKLNIWFLFIWLQNLKEDSLISQHSKTHHQQQKEMGVGKTISELEAFPVELMWSDQSIKWINA